MARTGVSAGVAQLFRRVSWSGMPKKQRQHFIPKLYLRMFSVDPEGKHIGVYNMPGRHFIERASLKGQAYIDNFYGKDGRIEDLLQCFENRAAPVLREVIRLSDLPDSRSSAFKDLLAFVILLRIRTRRFINDSANTIATFSEKSSLALGNRASLPDDFREKISYITRHGINTAISALPLVSDLAAKLIHNTSGIQLFTSDHPVIFLNPFLRGRSVTELGTLGLANKGLLSITPLSPLYCLILYDREVYSLGQRGKSAFEVSDPLVIEGINHLQVVSADENIFFRTGLDRQYLETMIRAARKDRRNRGTRVSTINSVGGTQNSLLLVQSKNPFRDYQLPKFVRIVRKARRERVRSQQDLVRSPELLEAFRAQGSIT